MLKSATIIILSILIFNVYSAHADMGKISASDADVTEDEQKAIILHNFEEEILILGTDLSSDKSTTILRFIPFPSEPEVTIAAPNAFDEIVELIKRCDLKFVSMPTKSDTSIDESSIEIKFNEKLGAHDITVVKINDSACFRQWVNDFFKEKGLPVKKSYPDVEGIVADYTKRKIAYFVFDLVDMTDEPRFIEPIMYRFKSERLYYPLKTTNTFGGRGEIDLIIASPATLCEPVFFEAAKTPNPRDLMSLYPCMPALTHTGANNARASTSAKISPRDLANVFDQAEVFFGDRDVYLQLVRYRGEYRFQDDVLVDFSQGTDRALGVPETGHNSPLKDWPMEPKPE